MLFSLEVVLKERWKMKMNYYLLNIMQEDVNDWSLINYYDDDYQGLCSLSGMKLNMMIPVL